MDNEETAEQTEQNEAMGKMLEHPGYGDFIFSHAIRLQFKEGPLKDHAIVVVLWDFDVDDDAAPVGYYCTECKAEGLCAHVRLAVAMMQAVTSVPPPEELLGMAGATKPVA